MSAARNGGDLLNYRKKAVTELYFPSQMTTGTNQQQKDVSGATLGSTCWGVTFEHFSKGQHLAGVGLSLCGTRPPRSRP